MKGGSEVPHCRGMSATPAPRKGDGPAFLVDSSTARQPIQALVFASSPEHYRGNPARIYTQNDLCQGILGTVYIRLPELRLGSRSKSVWPVLRSRARFVGAKRPSGRSVPDAKAVLHVSAGANQTRARG